MEGGLGGQVVPAVKRGVRLAFAVSADNGPASRESGVGGADGEECVEAGDDEAAVEPVEAVAERCAFLGLFGLKVSFALHAEGEASGVRGGCDVGGGCGPSERIELEEPVDESPVHEIASGMRHQWVT
jgi:hypothetical protein